MCAYQIIKRFEILFSIPFFRADNILYFGVILIQMVIVILHLTPNEIKNKHTFLCEIIREKKTPSCCFSVQLSKMTQRCR